MNKTQCLASLAAIAAAMAWSAAIAQSRWPAGDEIGMANTLGSATWQRCATQLANPNAKSYELSFVRSNTMPQSPFAVPLREKRLATTGIPGTRHAFNTDEMVSGDPGQQGTQMDALGTLRFCRSRGTARATSPRAARCTTAATRRAR